MPGTIGTLWGVAIAYLTASWPFYAQALLLAVIFALSVYASGEAAVMFDRSDPSQVVCDEITGYLIAVLFIPFTLFNAILAFILFRFFDILKPYPIRQIDRGVHGGLGIVLDDVLAGVFANVCAQAVLWLIRNQTAA